MSKSAIVLCLNGRRKKVKFNNNSTIFQILEDVCKGEKIDATQYELRTQTRKVLDNSLPWRYTNLPNNAKLELCQVESDNSVKSDPSIRIALQVEGGQRLTGEFPTTTSLSQIVQHFSKDLERMSTHDLGAVPKIVYMRQNFEGDEILSSTSLRMLGITKGSALLRFSYKSSDEISAAETVELTENASHARMDVQNHDNGIVETETEPPKDEVANDSLNHSEMDKPENLQSEPNADETCKPALIKCNERLTPKQNTENMDALHGAAPSINGPETSCLHANIKDVRPDSDNKSPMDVKPGPTSKISEPNTSTGIKRLKESPQSKTEEDYDFSKFEFPAATKGQQLMKNSSQLDDEILSTACERHVMLFDEKCYNVNEDAQEHQAEPDDFFDVTVDDVRKMLADLKHERNRHEEKALLTDDQRKNRKLRLASRYPEIIVRILFPDRVVLQGVFRPLERVEDLYNFVKSHVSVSSFKLFTSPPKRILKNDTTSLFDNNLTPAARVYFSSNLSPSMKAEDILKKTAFDNLCSLEEANRALKRYKAFKAHLCTSFLYSVQHHVC
ncbi:tether containing UBX domain for GLUT4-like isoform X2 [Clavelina lepadiformis]|uniref:UBX domain-containing protein n=1 Tax=Clavelina lepadiformis TaxID=159417 RepID=A0ABP0H1S5_CLALP